MREVGRWEDLKRRDGFTVERKSAMQGVPEKSWAQGKASLPTNSGWRALYSSEYACTRLSSVRYRADIDCTAVSCRIIARGPWTLD